MNVSLTPEDFRKVENELIDNIEFKNYVVQLASKLMPFIQADMSVGDIEHALEKFSPLGFMKIAEIMLYGDKQDTQLKAAIALVDRGGHVPVSKSVNIQGDLHHLSQDQLDSFLSNMWNRLPESDKKKMLKLVPDEGGTYRTPEEGEVPSVQAKDIPTEEL